MGKLVLRQSSSPGQVGIMAEKYLWKPTPAVVDHSNIARFMKRHGITGYRELVAQSTADIEWFWNAVVEDLGTAFYLRLSSAVSWPTHVMKDQFSVFLSKSRLITASRRPFSRTSTVPATLPS
jgi:hypothetical protein